MTTIVRDVERHGNTMRISFSGNDTLYPLPPDERTPISSLEDFQKIGIEYPSNGNYFLSKDLDFTDLGYVDYVPPSLINGKFDGNGHTITGLKVDNTVYTGDNYFMGLFKDLNYSLIKNLTVANFDMTSLIVAPLASTINGSRLVNCHSVGCNIINGFYGSGLFSLGSQNTIAQCTVTDAFVSGGASVGIGILTEAVNVIDCHVFDSTMIGVNAFSGFLGQLDKGGKVERCSTNAVLSFKTGEDEDYFNYAAGFAIAGLGAVEIINCLCNCTWIDLPVTVTGIAGGFIGIVDEGTQVENCYCVTHGVDLGFAGSVVDGTFVDSYWDITVSGQPSSPGGTGKTTAEMQICNTFASWDTDDVWVCVEGDYPTLREFTGYIEYLDTSPIEIGSVVDFQKIGVDVDYPSHRNYILTADLDLDGVTWVPIDLYNGQFNGNGHVLSNLAIDEPSSEGIALFDRVNVVRGLTILDSEIRGSRHVGLIAVEGGASGLIISDCTALNSRITGGLLIGSLAGSSESGQIEYCYSNSTVVCENALNPQQHEYFGGLCGSGSVAKYSTFAGTFEGMDSVSILGGISGQMSEAHYCTAVCDITGHTRVGGITASATRINNCHHIGTVAGRTMVGGLIAHNPYSGRYAYSTKLLNNYHSGDIIKIGDLETAALGPVLGYKYPYTFFNEVENCYYNSDSRIDGFYGEESNYYNGIGLSASEMTCPSTSFVGFDFNGVWDCVSGEMPVIKTSLLTAPEIDENTGNFLFYPVNDGQQFRDFRPTSGNNWWFENVYISFLDELTEGEEVKFIFYEKSNGKYWIQDVTEQEEFIQLPMPIQSGDRVVLTVTGPEGSEYQGPNYEGYVTYRK